MNTEKDVKEGLIWYDKDITESDSHIDIEQSKDYDILSIDDMNPSLRSPNSPYDLPFYQTKETLSDPESYRNFIKNCESRFRRSKEYKTYKSYLMSLGFDHCQIMGNIEYEDGVNIELHHNILNLFDDMILICEHILNTIGYISSFDLIQFTIQEHFENRIPITFLSTTAHQMYTNDEDAYIPPEMTFGKWWELLAKYKYGITFDIAKKVNRYIDKYKNRLPVSIDIQQQEQILNFAGYNEYGPDLNTNITDIPVNNQYLVGNQNNNLITQL